MPDTLLQLMPQSHISLPMGAWGAAARTGYSCSMLKWLLILIANGTACAGAWAQLPPQVAPEPSHPLTREQRRVELRTVLQAQSQRDAATTHTEALPLARHLSEQDRAEIRQQLRQQRDANPAIRP